MVSFNSLWQNHPGLQATPCDSEHVNQCAIKMSVAFEKSGVDLSTFKGVRCWNKEHKPSHILRAQELADWVDTQPGTFGLKKRHVKPGSEIFSGKKGLVFIQNGWGATDHIDVWDGTNLRNGYSDYFTRGTAIWFWELT